MKNNIVYYIGFCLAVTIAVLKCVTIYISNVNNQKDISAIVEAKNIDDWASYCRYAIVYPNGTYINEAIDSLTSKLFCENKHAIENCFHIVNSDSIQTTLARQLYIRNLEVNDIQRWREFVGGVPPKYHLDAQNRLDYLEKQLAIKIAWSSDESAWELVSKNPTAAVLNKYIHLFPNGKYVNVAQKILIDIEVENDFSGLHETMPKMEMTSKGGGAKSTISVKNDTEYELTILYSSINESKRLSIHSKETKKINLVNGSYRISAKVNTTGVRPYVGNETLTGGVYSSSYYITTTTSTTKSLPPQNHYHH